MFLQEDFIRARHEELLREANNYRLISQMRGHPSRSKNLYYLALAGLGSILSDLGDQMQERFGNPEVAPGTH